MNFSATSSALTSVKKNGYPWKLFGSLIILVIAIFAFVNWNHQEFLNTLTAVDKIVITDVLIALFFVMAQIGLQGSRLWILLDKQDRPSWLALMRTFSTGQVINNYLPAKAGDAFKIIGIGKATSPSQPSSYGQAAGSVLIADKLADIAALLLLIAFTRPDYFQLLQMPRFNLSYVWLIPMAGALAAVSIFLTHRFAPFFQVKIRTFFKQCLLGATSLRRPKRLMVALALGMCAWAAECLALMSLSSFLPAPLNFNQSLWALIVLNLGIAIPVTVANLGTFEATMVLGLAAFGIAVSDALALGVTHHFVQIFTVFVSAGLFWLLSEKRKPKSLISAQNREFQVRAEDKQKATQYYEKMSSNYNDSVEKGFLKVLRNKERGSTLKLAEFARHEGKTLIDVGCGGGFYSLAAKEAGLKVHAVDICPGMVERLKEKVDQAWVHDIDTLTCENTFDIVLCSGALDFVLHPEQAMKNLCRLVTPGGKLVILVPKAGLAGFIYRTEKRLFNMKVNLYSLSWLDQVAKNCGLNLVFSESPLPINLVALWERPPTCVSENEIDCPQ